MQLIGSLNKWANGVDTLKTRVDEAMAATSR